MRILIAYGTRYGTVEKSAQMLSTLLGGDVKLANLTKEKVDVAAFDTVIIGSNITAGKINGKVKNFLAKNLDVLLGKKIGIFLCHLAPPEVAKEQRYFEVNFPESLLKVAKARGLFGGEAVYSRMFFLHSFILKKINGKESDIHFLQEGAIKEFAEKMK